MSHKTKAVLLTLLVFPGAGHIYLKSTPRGVALILISVVALWMILSQITERVALILQRVQSQGDAIDLTLMTLIQEQSAVIMANSTLPLFLILVCWLIALMDAYRLGKKMDAEQLS